MFVSYAVTLVSPNGLNGYPEFFAVKCFVIAEN